MWNANGDGDVDDDELFGWLALFLAGALFRESHHRKSWKKLLPTKTITFKVKYLIFRKENPR